MLSLGGVTGAAREQIVAVEGLFIYCKIWVTGTECRLQYCSGRSSRIGLGLALGIVKHDTWTVYEKCEVRTSVMRNTTLSSTGKTPHMNAVRSRILDGEEQGAKTSPGMTGAPGFLDAVFRQSLVGR